MKLVWIFLCASLWFNPGYAAFNPVTPEKLALAKQIVILDNSREMLQASVKAVIAQTRSSLPPNTPETFFASFEQNIDQEKMLEDLVQAYSSTYSEQDMKALIAFYQTAEGKQVAAKFPDIAVKIAELSSNTISDALQETLQQQSQTSPSE